VSRQDYYVHLQSTKRRLLADYEEESMIYTHKHSISSSGGCSGSNIIGWIVPAVESTTKTLLSRRGPESINNNSCSRLAIWPLVAFPSSERNSYMVQIRAFGRLEQVGEDFFSIISTTATKNTTTTTTTRSKPRARKCRISCDSRILVRRRACPKGKLL
jgi:hypothetical protein